MKNKNDLLKNNKKEKVYLTLIFIFIIFVLISSTIFFYSLNQSSTNKKKDFIMMQLAARKVVFKINNKKDKSYLYGLYLRKNFNIYENIIKCGTKFSNPNLIKICVKNSK